jgi:GxxExxY protein
MYRDDLLLKEEMHKIIGAAMAVHRYFGCGFTEKVYQDALEIELANRSIPSLREPELKIEYNGKVLASSFKPDFICYDSIVVELKAVKELDDMHRSQAINYGKVAGSDIALLVNFGETSLKFERYLIKKNH